MQRAQRAQWSARPLLGLLGMVTVIVVWWLAIAVCARPDSLASQSSPWRALLTLPTLVSEDQLWLQIATSLRRISIGLGCALLIGLPLGFTLGRLRTVEAALSPTLQFLRVISPLSWMPIAVMSPGIGEHAVNFLLAFATLWPTVMSTAFGVAQIDKRWVALGHSLAATRLEMVRHIYAPGIAAHVLTGVRLATGILWIVLVPAKMLGVSSGLGYLNLDCRDRLAYAELAATILLIGGIGFALDCLARFAYQRFADGL